MRKSIKSLVNLVATTIPINSPIYEFGSYQTEGQEGFADLRNVFSGKDYIGCDMRLGPGVDKIIDLHDIRLETESVNTALLLDTLEHVEFPHRAMDEIYRILTPNGFTLITSVMNFPIHSYPDDYWRFTPAAFGSLLKRFNFSIIDYVGDKNFPHTVIGLGFKGDCPNLDQFFSGFNLWKEIYSKSSSKEKIKQLLPPILVRFYENQIRKYIKK